MASPVHSPPSLAAASSLPPPPPHVPLPVPNAPPPKPEYCWWCWCSYGRFSCEPSCDCELDSAAAGNLRPSPANAQPWLQRCETHKCRCGPGRRFAGEVAAHRRDLAVLLAAVVAAHLAHALHALRRVADQHPARHLVAGVGFLRRPLLIVIMLWRCRRLALHGRRARRPTLHADYGPGGRATTEYVPRGPSSHRGV